MPVQHSHKHNRHIHSYLKRAAPHRHGSPPSAGWTIPDLCQAYKWQVGGAVGGGNIYIVELGGGWNQADVDAAFAAMNLPAPNITDLSADGTTTNTPGSDADGEVALDIQCAGGAYALATGKAANIFMVWGSDIAACLTFAAAHANGPVLPFAAAGDNDSSDGGTTPANVDCPASCPSVIGCGGTSKPLNGPEVVWNNNPGQTDGSGTGGSTNGSTGSSSKTRQDAIIGVVSALGALAVLILGFLIHRSWKRRQEFAHRRLSDPDRVAVGARPEGQEFDRDSLGGQRRRSFYYAEDSLTGAQGGGDDRYDYHASPDNGMRERRPIVPGTISSPYLQQSSMNW